MCTCLSVAEHSGFSFVIPRPITFTLLFSVSACLYCVSVLFAWETCNLAAICGSDDNEQVPNTGSRIDISKSHGGKCGETNKKVVINLTFFICQRGTSVTASLPTWKGKKYECRELQALSLRHLTRRTALLGGGKTGEGNSLSLMYSNAPKCQVSSQLERV